MSPAILDSGRLDQRRRLETEARIQDALAVQGPNCRFWLPSESAPLWGLTRSSFWTAGAICRPRHPRELLETSDVYQEIYRSQLGESVS